MATIRSLQNQNTVQLAIFYMLQCIETSTDNNYIIIVSKHNTSESCLSRDIELAEIFHHETNIKHTFALQVGGCNIRNINITTNQPDIQTIRFVKGKEHQITEHLCQLSPKQFNSIISEFYGTNFDICKRIDYSMATTLKLKQWNINYSNIIHNASQISKSLEHKKRYHHKHFMKCPKNPNFNNERLETIEMLIMRTQYKEALIMLDLDTNKSHNTYLLDIYRLLVFMASYDINREEYFIKMIDLLSNISNFMQHSDALMCSLFADILLNYNPYSLTEKDIQFINHLVISSCCFMHSDSDTYQISGSMNAYLLLLRLIRENKLDTNDNIYLSIIHNMDILCAMFSAIDTQAASKVFYLRICHAKMLWEIEKKEILNKIEAKQKVNHYNDNEHETKVQEVQLVCKKCGKSGFKNKHALSGHQTKHRPKRKKRQNVKSRTNKTSNKSKEEMVESDSDQSLQWKPTNITAHRRSSRRREPKIICCKYCDYKSDHKGNFKRHVLTHGNQKRNSAKRGSNKRINTTKQAQKSSTSDDSKIDERYVKNERRNDLQCTLCGKICKTKAGVGTHKYHTHGIGADSVKSKKPKSRKRVIKLKKKCDAKKDIITIFDDSDDNDVQILRVNTDNAPSKKKMKFSCDVAGCGETFGSFAQLITHKSHKHDFVETDADEYHDFNVQKS